MQNNKLIIIPAFNEEATIKIVIESISKIYDVLVVDDGSTDKTVEICNEIGTKVISHEKNKGYESALITGIRFFLKSNFESFVIIDADGEIDPKSAMKILEKVNKENPLICGYRINFYGRTSEKLISFVTSYLFNIKDIYCGCKAIHRSIVVNSKPEDIAANTFILFAINYSRKNKISNMPVTGNSRIDESRYGKGFKAEIFLVKNFIYALKKIYTN